MRHSQHVNNTRNMFTMIATWTTTDCAMKVTDYNMPIILLQHRYTTVAT
jgi:hypothetical protein